MAAVWYLGAGDRSITAAQWTAAGITGSPTDSVWNAANGWSIPAASFTSPQLTLLAADGGFNTAAADGPNTGRSAGGTGGSPSAFVNQQFVQSMLDSLAADTATKYPHVSRVADLVWTGGLPIFHRGASNLFPENTLQAYEGSVALGCQAVEAGDIVAASDGGLICIHNLTVDYSTNGVGNVSAYSTPGIKRLVADASAWFGGGQADITVPTWDEVLDRIGGRVVIVPEVKDVSDATAIAMCAKLVKRGLQKSAIIVSAQLTNLAIVVAAGIEACYETFSTGASASAATIAAAGIHYACIDVSSDTSGALTTWVANMHAVGIKCIAGTQDHQKAWDLAISQGFDGCYSNDPVYASRNYAQYRMAATQWKTNGTWSHGMVLAGGAGEIPLTPATRGSFIGVAGAWRWACQANGFNLPGAINPVPSPGGTYTVTTVAAFDSLPTTTSQGAQVFIAAATDNDLAVSGNVPNSYLAKMRQTGVIQVWEIDGSGTATSKGTITTTVPSQPVLSAGLTAGVAITSIPVNAIPVALKVGHQFYLPTGQVVTLTAAASIGATSLTVASVTPSAAVASATALIPRITLVVAVTPTTVTVSRADETSVAALAVTDSAHRGGYVIISNAVNAGAGSVSFESVTVS